MLIVHKLLGSIEVHVCALGALQCNCSDDCAGETTCNTTSNGVCYTQYYSDISGKHWNWRKGCLDDPSSVICKYARSDVHTNRCCNDKDMCNNDFKIGE